VIAPNHRDFLFFRLRAIEFNERSDEQMQNDRQAKSIDQEVLHPLTRIRWRTLR
jgi:hypothetical protein